jgi:hypothetical protein
MAIEQKYENIRQRQLFTELIGKFFLIVKIMFREKEGSIFLKIINLLKSIYYELWFIMAVLA